MRVIILAAGQAVQLDGYNKLLIKDPVTKKTILDMYLEAFKGHDITVVLGYRAINVMHEYSDLDYVYNSDWAISNSSHSLSLALNEEPCFVISGDLFIDPEIIAAIDNAGPNIVASLKRDSRTLNALNISHDVNQNVHEIYQGKLKNVNDPEAIGIYKISSKSILKSWRANCLKHSNLFVGQNLDLDSSDPLLNLDVSAFRLQEVNTPMDYLRILSDSQSFNIND